MDDFMAFWSTYHFTSIWYILWPFGIFYGPLVCFSTVFGMLYQGESGNPTQVSEKHQVVLNDILVGKSPIPTNFFEILYSPQMSCRQTIECRA
jgi:hypothetical protein